MQNPKDADTADNKLTKNVAQFVSTFTKVSKSANAKDLEERAKNAKDLAEEAYEKQKADEKEQRRRRNMKRRRSGEGR